MDYAIELQRIMDALREDTAANKYWKNKLIGHITELQPWCLMLYETPSFSDPMPLPQSNMPQFAPGQTPVTMDHIPADLREFADPTRFNGPQEPQQ